MKPKLIIEMNSDDLVSADSDKKLLRTKSFSWDPQKSEFAYVGLASCPKLMFPSFLKVREDKNIDSGCSRIEQVL